MIHPDMANVKKDDIKTQLVKKFNTKEDRITVYGLKTRFGGGRSSGFALIYNSKEDKVKYDSKTALKKVGFRIPRKCKATKLNQIVNLGFGASFSFFRS